MDRAIAMLVIGLVFGGGLGFVLAAANGVTLDGHDHGSHGHGPAHTAGTAQTAHHHGPPHQLPAGSADLGIGLTPDPVSGWNLFVQLRGMCLAPDRAGLAHAPGQGHAHLYLNGDKIARLYGPAQHLPQLRPGDRLRVELNGNDHRPLAVAGQPLAVELRVPDGATAVAAGTPNLPAAAICAPS
ncbi:MULTISPECIES: hypothetical protein [unclassified Paracoccus (in: a-proteobacteria)]|uniref:hypothetical protein n=1 Tax=unclassified Paracoccus (in: a-proteobacteria) TaxID=2688777 RepID=UPI0012B1AD12|nr:MULTISPECIES: hypothetical protein [unclassified Paracoccus (in: a-proteobacteria)]UXU75987.1 hypothetical protein GB879_005755 [Paracoccus sp. SMMA_5]UXU81896.1 hypothetical protein GB880_005740 [Paracoccus sp. SMMA_5_TC]